MSDLIIRSSMTHGACNRQLRRMNTHWANQTADEEHRRIIVQRVIIKVDNLLSINRVLDTLHSYSAKEYALCYDDHQPKQIGILQGYDHMKHLKTSARDLRELFDRSISVKHVAEPLSSFDEKLDCGPVRSFMERQDYDVVGVRRDGMVYGYVKRTDINKGALQEYVTSFDPVFVVGEDSPLLDVFVALRNSSQVFVTLLGQVGGIVTRGDLQKPPIRMWLFGVISLIEMQFLRIIRENYPNDSWREKNLISDDRLTQALCILEDRKRRNEEIDLVDCLQLGDKRKIILKSGEMYKKLGFESKKAAGRILEDLEDLRDNLAHAQDIVTGDWPKIAELADQAETILQRCEEITTAA